MEKIGANKNVKSISKVLVPHDMVNTKLNYKILLLYAQLRRFMNNETKECFPSIKKLVELSGLSDKTVSKYLKILEDEKHIQIKKQGNKKPNIYKFNTDSNLYKGFEQFTTDFLDSPILAPREKAAYIAWQQRMFNKDSGIANMSYTDMDLIEQLGDVSYKTFKSICRNMIQAGVLTITENKAIDSTTGLNKNTYSFNLEILGQAILYNQKKLAEHEERIKKVEKQTTDMHNALNKVLQENIELKEEIKKTKNE